MKLNRKAEVPSPHPVHLADVRASSLGCDRPRRASPPIPGTARHPLLPLCVRSRPVGSALLSQPRQNPPSSGPHRCLLRLLPPSPPYLWAPGIHAAACGSFADLAQDDPHSPCQLSSACPFSLRLTETRRTSARKGANAGEKRPLPQPGQAACLACPVTVEPLSPLCSPPGRSNGRSSSESKRSKRPCEASGTHIGCGPRMTLGQTVTENRPVTQQVSQPQGCSSYTARRSLSVTRHLSLSGAALPPAP